VYVVAFISMTSGVLTCKLYPTSGLGMSLHVFLLHQKFVKKRVSVNVIHCVVITS
jgi:hypothetical protein